LKRHSLEFQGVVEAAVVRYRQLAIDSSSDEKQTQDNEQVRSHGSGSRGQAKSTDPHAHPLAGTVVWLDQPVTNTKHIA
jgi:hypothetical protein